MTELTQHAVLLLRYEGVDYPICGYSMPLSVLSRADVLPDVLRDYDIKHGARLEAEVRYKLKLIYDTVILPADIKAIAALKYPEPPASVVDFMGITRMFG